MLVVKMEKFYRAFEMVIGNEGGYVFDKDDKGGETKFGISKRSYPDLDIKNLSLEEAREIYLTDFWNTERGNLEMLPESVAIEVFDTGVNMGIEMGRKILQRSLNLLNRIETLYPDLKVDGWLGDTTLKALEKVETSKLLKVLNGLQFMKYYSIVEHDHSQEKFFAGWIERV